MNVLAKGLKYQKVVVKRKFNVQGQKKKIKIVPIRSKSSKSAIRKKADDIISSIHFAP